MARRPRAARLSLAVTVGVAVVSAVLGPGAGSGAAAVAGPGPAPTSGVPRSVAETVATSSAPATRLVVLAAGDVDAAQAAARSAGGRVVAVQPAVGSVVVDVRRDDAPAVAARLAASPAVRSVSPDRELHSLSLGEDAAGEDGSMGLVADIVGARALWRRGITGEGVGVALLDTGVAPVPGLQGADKVEVGPDLSFESQNPALRNLDTFGHGTHMAGIIAGRDGGRASGATYAASTRRFLGVAPDATIVSLKLADHYGAVDVSQVVAAIDWVVQHRDDTRVRIRVINLSFGTPSRQSPGEDPLSFAAEVASRHGILVVAAAGNNGSNGDGLNDPAYDPNVLAVGSTATDGTETTRDDKVSSFSARPGGAASWRGPDVVAPGTSIVSLRVPGSYVAEEYPAAAVGRHGMRGSGTSQSAAVVSGAAALLVQQRPWLRPAQVKGLLMASANRLSASQSSAGEGSVDVDRASRLLWAGSARTTVGTGTGSLEQARGGVHVSDGSVELTGERDVMGSPWRPGTARLTEAGRMWGDDGSWNGALWTGPGFAPDGGPAGSWTGRTWSGRTWSGRTWSGRTWSGRTWSDATWSAAEGGWSATRWPAPQEGDEFAAELWGTTTWVR